MYTRVYHLELTAMPQWPFLGWLSFLPCEPQWTSLCFSFTGLSPNEQRFRDCAEAYKSGHNTSGVYHIFIGDMTEPTKVWDAFFHKYGESVWYILAVTYRTRNSANVREWDWDVSYASDRSFVIWWQVEVAGQYSNAELMEVWTSRKAGKNTNWWVDIKPKITQRLHVNMKDCQTTTQNTVASCHHTDKCCSLHL